MSEQQVDQLAGALCEARRMAGRTGSVTVHRDYCEGEPCTCDVTCVHPNDWRTCHELAESVLTPTIH